MHKALITGSSGLIGSEAVAFFDERGWEVHGIDNNMRKEFFGSDGDTAWNLERLKGTTRHFTHHELDIRNRPAILELFRSERPRLIIHSAAQPSHDLARLRVFDDFEINAAGTLNLLEASRIWYPESPFIFMSTNKVYGNALNELDFKELGTRYDDANSKDQEGISETCRIDGALHSLFGASKLAADVMVQEYGRYFGMPTVCFRASCLTGPYHAGAELHGFLAYLARAIREERPYRIYGYKGKQVRDNLHSYDVCTAFLAFFENPKTAAVYNLGGGRSNSVSVNESITRFEDLTGKRLKTEYIDEPRRGDHICYLTNLGRLKSHYPGWSISRSLDDIFLELTGHAPISKKGWA